VFRLFLRKKVFSAGAAKGAKAAKRAESAADLVPSRRNRRTFARYAVDHKHLTLMNDQDILLVREISAKGFSTEVSKRGVERLVVGDVYDARIRYLGEIYGLEARVAWKQASFVGFEIVKAARETLMFIRRLLKPVEIAASLRAVETSFMNEGNIGKTWYHGDEDSDLYTWHHPETNELKAWQLTIGDTYIEWTENRGLTTGAVRAAPNSRGAALLGASLAGQLHEQDGAPDGKKKQLAVDVVMALPHEVREEILETLTA
jgi:hypothetical protein